MRVRCLEAACFPQSAEGSAERAGKGRRRAAERLRARDTAECHINEEDNLVFEGGFRVGCLCRLAGCLPLAEARTALGHASRRPASTAGAVYSRGGLAEVGAALEAKRAAELRGSEGLLLRVRADEHAYTCVVRTASGATHTAKFSTRLGYSTVRLPFNTFRSVSQDDPPLSPGVRPHWLPSAVYWILLGTVGTAWQANACCAAHMPLPPPPPSGEITYIGVRFEPRIKLLEEVRGLQTGSLLLSLSRPGLWCSSGVATAGHHAPTCLSPLQVTLPGQSMFDQSANRFRLELDWVKALPGGIETDFVLVSCAGTPRPGALGQAGQALGCQLGCCLLLLAACPSA